MQNKNLAIGLLITVVIAITGVFTNLDFIGDMFGKASGPAHYQHESFLQGMSGGVRDQFSVDNTGNVTSSGSFALSGAVALTSTLSVTGATDVGIFTQGGGCTASSTTVATELWTEADLLAANCFTYSGTTLAAAITISLPATSTMTTLLPNAGDTRKFFYDPAGYAAATTTTFAAGTGIILMEPDGQDVVIAGATSAANGRKRDQRKRRDIRAGKNY